MKKRIIVVMLAFCTVFAFFLAGCFLPTDENGYAYWYHEYENGYEFIIGLGFDVENTEVVVPAEYKGKPVVSITGFGFSNLSGSGDSIHTGQTDKIKSITLPHTIKRIDAGAFNECVELEQIIVSSENPIYKSEGNCIIEIATDTLIMTCKESVVPQDITYFAQGAFSDGYRLKNAPDNSLFYVNKDWWGTGEIRGFRL